MKAHGVVDMILKSFVYFRVTAMGKLVELKKCNMVVLILTNPVCM